MISEHLQENLLLHVTKQCLNFTTKTWKCCRPQICRRVFILNGRALAVSVKNYTAVTFVLYQTQKICLARVELSWKWNYDLLTTTTVKLMTCDSVQAYKYMLIHYHRYQEHFESKVQRFSHRDNQITISVYISLIQLLQTCKSGAGFRQFQK